jgi:hypothetical protein
MHTLTDHTRQRRVVDTEAEPAPLLRRMLTQRSFCGRRSWCALAMVAIACGLLACGGRARVEQQGPSVPVEGPGGPARGDAAAALAVEGGGDATLDATTHAVEAGPDADADVDEAGALPPRAPVGTVLFGGASDGYASDSLGDTWIWNGSSWSQYDGPGPPARSFAAMAPLAGTLVLFGGGTGTFAETYLSDTWTWSQVGWTRQTGPGPSARSNASIATLGNVVVLYGGEGPREYDLLGDTWTWDGVAWKELDAAGPPARYGANMIAVGDVLVLWGGSAGYPNGPTDEGPTLYDDEWIWDGGSWAPGAPSGFVQPPLPGALAQLGGTFVVAAGCWDCTDPGTDAGLAQTWVSDGGAWTELDATGPTAAVGGMVAAAGTLLTFGGLSATQGALILGDTWTWDGTGWHAYDGAAPPARAFQMMGTP